jgi:hypothetical protein
MGLKSIPLPSAKAGRWRTLVWLPKRRQLRQSARKHKWLRFEAVKDVAFDVFGILPACPKTEKSENLSLKMRLFCFSFPVAVKTCPFRVELSPFRGLR